MIIEIESKTGTRTATIEAGGADVPRAGEEIHLHQDGGYLQGNTRLMVHEVTWVLKDDAVIAHVRCQPSRFSPDLIDQARRELLEELGWHPVNTGLQG